MELERSAAEPGDPRLLAEAALRAGDAVAACDFAEAAMKTAARAGWARCCALLDPEHACGEDSVKELYARTDAEVASTAIRLPEAAQVPEWCASYAPPALRLLSLRNWTALAPNVLVSRAGHLLNDHVGYPPAELWRHGVAEFPGFAAAGGQIVVCEDAAQTVRIDKPSFYLNASSNYAAWMMGDLPRLALLSEVRDAGVVMHGDIREFHRASLALVGLDPGRVVEVPAAARLECAQIYYPISTYRHHAPSAHALAWLREKLLQSLGSGFERRALYLARRNYPASRPMLNEDELIAMLQARGYAAIDAERFPVRDQIGMTSAARGLVAPYGAALANALFARSDALVMIIATKTQPEFARLLSVAGIPFAHVIAQQVKLREGRNVSESFGFRADVDELARVLDGPSLAHTA